MKYKTDAMRAYKRATLSRVGAGFGGYVPCADVVLGLLRYYVQGFDAQGSPAGNTGDPKHPFTVAIRESITSAPPSLPGMAAPRTCGEDETEALRLEDGERCREDNQCKSGTCADGRCARAERSANIVTERYARLWLGVSSAADLALTPAGTNACKQGGAVPGTGYWCTNPDGTDYPTGAQNKALIDGHAGNLPGGVAAGTVHVVLSADYAATPSFLVGVRFGYVAQAYTGHAAVDAGRTIAPPIHAELRATYVFGSEPLSRGGLAPYAMFGAGVSHFDVSATAQVIENGVVGAKAVQAWVVGGPWFAAVGTGVRYAFSPVIAFWAGAKMTAAFGSGGLIGIASPEIGLQRGF